MISKRALILHAIESARAAIRRASQRADEALGAASAASITRRGARRINVYNAEGKLVRTRLVGAPDASRTVGRITEPEIPLHSFKSDLERKKGLSQVMPARTGILDDHDCDDADRDAEGRCPDDPDYDADTAGQYETTEESVYGMAQPDGPRSKAPDDLVGQDLGRYLDERGKKLPADDPKVNLRFSASHPPVPGARCGSCVYFEKESAAGCAIVSNPLTAQLVCDLWTPAKKGEGAAIQTFADEMQR